MKIHNFLLRLPYLETVVPHYGYSWIMLYNLLTFWKKREYGILSNFFTTPGLHCLPVSWLISHFSLSTPPQLPTPRLLVYPDSSPIALLVSDVTRVTVYTRGCKWLATELEAELTLEFISDRCGRKSFCTFTCVLLWEVLGRGSDRLPVSHTNIFTYPLNKNITVVAIMLHYLPRLKHRHIKILFRSKAFW